MIYVVGNPSSLILSRTIMLGWNGLKGWAKEESASFSL